MIEYLKKDNVERIRKLAHDRNTSDAIYAAAMALRYSFVGAISDDVVNRRWQQALSRWDQLRSIIREINGQQMLVVLRNVPFALEYHFLDPAQKQPKTVPTSAIDLRCGPLCHFLVEQHVDHFEIEVTIAEGLLSVSEIGAITLWLAKGETPKVRSTPDTVTRAMAWTPLPGTAAVSQQGFSKGFILSEELSRDVVALSERLGCTCAELLVASWVMLFSVYNDTEDVAIEVASVACSQRSEVWSANVVGESNLIDISSKISRSECRSALSREALSNTPNKFWLHDDIPDLRCTDVIPTMPASALDVHIFDSKKFPKLMLSGRGDPEIGDRIIAHFGALLKYCVANPDCVNWRVHFRTESEQAIIEANCLPPRDTFRPYVDMINEMVERFPDRICLRYGARSLVYQDFVNLVAAQSAQLQRHNLAPGHVVAVMAQRSPELVAAIVAIHNAGCIYLPMDPDGTRDRNRSILSVAQPTIILTSDRDQAMVEVTLDGVGDHPKVVVFGVPEARGRVATQIPNDYSPAADQPANIFFTSGTTGDPKGAVLHHEGVWNHLLAKIEICGIDRESIIAQNSAHTFDISIWQMLAPLLVGGCVVIYPSETANNPKLLLPALRDDRVTILETVPTYIREINRIRRGGYLSLPNLEIVISNAEALSAKDCAEWLQLNPTSLLVNTYGATECSDDVTHRIFAVGPDRSAPYLSVGHPIAGSAVLVLGRHGMSQPVGCPGEVYITGVCVGLGYLNDEKRTAGAFLSDSSNIYAERPLYRTGDRGYLLPSGELVILGREDDQVKVNGHRVELGEIVAAISGIDGLRSFHVMIETGPDDAKRIECFCVPEHGSGSDVFDPAKMADVLEPKLPSYMIPSVYHVVDHIPLNSHGKVDQQGLRGMVANDRRASAHSPENKTEKMLYRIWAELLERVDFGIDDDFFELGGNSLRTIELRYRLKKDIQVDVALADFFSARTIRQLAQKVNWANAVQSTLPPITSACGHGSVEVSPLQHGLWFLHQIEPDQSTYNMVESLLLPEGVDEDALRAALEDLLDRHPVLSCNIVPTPDGLALSPRPQQKRTTIEFIDECCGGCGALNEIFAEENERTFNLETDTLLRLKVVRLTSGRHALLIAMHHIISDERSWQVIKRDLTNFYDRRLRTQAEPVRPEPLHYLDFAKWHAEWCRSDDVRNRLDSWRRKLTDVDLWVDLPGQKVSVQSEKADFRSVEFTLPAELVELLEALCKKTETSPFVGGLALYAIFLSALSGRRHFCVATPINCRSLIGLPDCVGLFANLLPLRLEVTEKLTFRDVLAALRDTLHDAADDAIVPLHMIVEAVQSDRAERRKNTFSSAYFQEENNVAGTDLFEIAEVLPQSGGRDQFDLNITAQPDERGLTIRFDYNAAQFDDQAIQEWANFYCMAGKALITDSSSPIGELDVFSQGPMSSAVSSELIRKSPKTVVELVIEQANRTPEAIAVSTESETLTYGALVASAVETASNLSNYNQQPGKLLDPVVVSMAPSVDLPIALLAAMITGRGFVPIDPGMPRSRIAEICANCGAELAMIDESESSSLSGIVRNTLGVSKTRGPVAQPVKVPESNTKAYVIYTSGSTGKPKGVEIAQTSLSNTIQSVNMRIGSGEAVSVLSFTSIGFDIFQLELWLPLITGGVCHLYASDIVLEPIQVAALIKKIRPSVIQTTPSTWSLILPVVKHELEQTVALVGGEELPKKLAKLLRRSAKRTFNCYGPTEATIWASMTEVKTAQPVQIGNALPNVDLFVAGENGLAVPNGIAGELLIASDALAEGYVNLPQETDKQFVLDSRRGNNRLYRTGDIVRQERGGVLTFLGRRDKQVKIRGRRIELPEIESAISEYAEVEQCVALCLPHPHLQHVLVGAVRPELSSSKLSDIEAELRARLPDYMVPHRWFSMDALPLTANGKIDRRRLAKDLLVAKPLASNIQPRTSLEGRILSVWQDFLGNQEFGVEDDFFRLGGNSIAAVSLAQRLTSELGYHVAVMDIFRAPTVAEIARISEKYQFGRTSDTTVFSLNRSDAPEKLFLIHPQGGGVERYHDLASCLDGKIAVYGVQAIGYDDKLAPFASVDEMASRYADDIQACCAQDHPIHLGGWSFGGSVAVEVTRILTERGREVGFLGLFDAKPFHTGAIEEAEISELALKRWFVSVHLEKEDINENLLDLDELNVLLETWFSKNFTANAGQEALANVNHLIDFMRHNVRVAATYRFRAAVETDIWLFTVSELPLKEKRALVDVSDWEQFTEGQIHQIEVSGHHHTMFSPEYAADLAKVLGACLEKYLIRRAAKLGD